MSVFGIRRKIKAGVKKALGMEEGPSDTAAPNWQNRPPTPPAAQAAPEESAATEGFNPNGGCGSHGRGGFAGT